MENSKKHPVGRSESVDDAKLEGKNEPNDVNCLNSGDSIANNGDQKPAYCHKRMMSFPFLNSEDIKANEFAYSEWRIRAAFRNLCKIFRIFMILRFNQWKRKSNTGNSQKLFGMISILHRLFMNRGKRVFQPPRIIKDADEIMTRTIKKLIQIKQRLLESALTRWKYLKVALYTKEKAIVFYRACCQAGHLFNDSFQIWKSKTSASDSIKRTAATDKFQRVLSKSFRSRFKLFVFSTYLKTGPKKAISKIFNLLNKKILEDRRLGLERFKAFIRILKRKNQQIRNDKKVFRLFWSWNKVLKMNLKRGWVRLGKTKKNKGKLVKLIIRKLRTKKNQCWDIWKGLIKVKNFKFLGFKLQCAVSRVTRRQQHWAFSRFQRKKIIFGSISVFQQVYKNFLTFALNKIKVIAKDNQVIHIKDTTKFIRSNYRKTQLRSTRLTGKNLSNLQKLLKKHWKILFSAHETIKSQQLSLKLCSKYFLSKPKDSVLIWKQFSTKKFSESMKNSLNSEKLKLILYRVLRKTMKNILTQIMEKKIKVLSATRVFTRQLGKKPKLVISKWHKTIEAINHGLLFDACRAQKLKEALNKILQLCVKKYFVKICEKPVVAFKVLKNLFRGYCGRARVSFDVWRRNGNEIEGRRRLNRIKSGQFCLLVRKAVARRCQEYFKGLVMMDNKVKVALRAVFLRVSQKILQIFRNWKKNVEADKQKHYIIKLYSVILEMKLRSVAKQTIFKAFKELTKLKPQLSKVIENLLFKLVARTQRIAISKILNKSQAYLKVLKVCNNLMQSQKQVLNKWKTQTLLAKHQKKHDWLRALNLKKSITSAAQRVKSQNFSILTKNSFTKSIILIKLSNTAQKILRFYIKAWQSSISQYKTSKFLTQFQANQLKTSALRLVKRKFSSFTHNLLHPLNPMRKFLCLWLQNYRQKLKQTLTQWQNFKHQVQTGELFDAVRSSNLKKHLENIHKKLIRDSLDRILGHGNKVRGHLRRIILQLQKSLFLGFSEWKNWLVHKRSSLLWLKLKSCTLNSALLKILEKRVRLTIDQIIGNGKMVLGKILRIAAHFKYKYLNCFCKWKEVMSKLKQRDVQRGSKLPGFFMPATKKIMKVTLECIVGDRRIRRVIEKIVKNLKFKQNYALQLLWARVEKVRTIRKINAAFMLARHLLIHCKQIVKARFLYWKNLEHLRKRRILRKAIGKMIQNMSINFESGLWKWKFIMTRCGKQLNPRHSIFFKRLLAICSSYQSRLEQFALFKLVLNFKSQQLASSRVTLPKAIAKIIKTTETENKQKVPIAYDQIVEYGEKGCNKVIQIGGLEILFISLNCIKLRKYAWALSAIFANFRYIDGFESEREYFKEQITELRYERSSLLEDNNILRVHNDNLISSLERNTEDLQEISLNMDFLRISSMFKIFARVLEANMQGSFFRLCLTRSDI